MGITSKNNSASPSLLINRKHGVPGYEVPRVPSELQLERKKSADRTRYLRRLAEDTDMSWSAQRRREFEEMKKRRSEGPAQ